MTIPGWRILEWVREPQQEVDELLDGVVGHAIWCLGRQYDLHQTRLLPSAILTDRRSMWSDEE